MLKFPAPFHFILFFVFISFISILSKPFKYHIPNQKANLKHKICLFYARHHHFLSKFSGSNNCFQDFQIRSKDGTHSLDLETYFNTLDELCEWPNSTINSILKLLHSSRYFILSFAL